MRGKLGTGKHLDETYLLEPQAVPHDGVASWCRRSRPLWSRPINGGHRSVSR
jgi:hypothetical protein